MDYQNPLQDLVHPVVISTPFAVGDVLCYIIDDEKKVLVDCGHKSEQSLAILKKKLLELNLDLSDVDEVWLTHGHPDHFGQAARMADISGAKIIGHTKERSNFACNDNSVLFEAFFEDEDIPPAQISMMTEQLDWLQQFQMPIKPDWITEDHELSSGRLTFRVKHTPGHAPGHLTFYSDSGIIFGGDVLLEHISTNALINFDPDTQKRNKSLLQYRESLKWMGEQEGVVLPGHGKFIRNIREVADHHLKDHERRYRGIRQLLSRKGYSLYDLALKTFPDAMQKGATFLVLSEVLGYLDWGLEEGVIEKVDGIYGPVS